MDIAGKFVTHNKIYGDGEYYNHEDDDDDDEVNPDVEDEEEEEQARQTMKENKLYGFKLQYIKIGDFVPKYWYPHQFRVRANTLDEQLEISFFRYTARYTYIYLSLFVCLFVCFFYLFMNSL